MRGRCKSHEEQSRVRVAKSGNGAAPVRVISMCAFLVPGDTATVMSQARAPFARDDGLVNLDESPRKLDAQPFHERLGHKNIEMRLNIYGHVLPSMQHDAARSLATLLHG